MRGPAVVFQRMLVIDQLGVRDQLAQHHRGGLERLDLDILVAARVGMLDDQRPDGARAVDDRHTGEGVEFVLPGFGAISEVGMRGRLGEVKHLDIGGDGANQPFAHSQPGNMNRVGVKTAGGEEFESAVAQQVDRADLAIERLADDLHDLVELALRLGARGHHLVQAGEDQAGTGSGGHHPPL